LSSSTHDDTGRARVLSFFSLDPGKSQGSADAVEEAAFRNNGDAGL
jgi:hypothetical protein